MSVYAISIYSNSFIILQLSTIYQDFFNSGSITMSTPTDIRSVPDTDHSLPISVQWACFNLQDPSNPLENNSQNACFLGIVVYCKCAQKVFIPQRINVYLAANKFILFACKEHSKQSRLPSPSDLFFPWHFPDFLIICKL